MARRPRISRSPTAPPAQPRRAPDDPSSLGPPSSKGSDLRFSGALLEYAVGLPCDHLKLVLRLLQRARWIRTSTADGPARELRFFLSVNDLWAAMLLDRDAVQDVAPFRHVLDRLERGDLIGDAPDRDRSPGPEETP
jgi:hypothetical protein